MRCDKTPDLFSQLYNHLAFIDKIFSIERGLLAQIMEAVLGVGHSTIDRFKNLSKAKTWQANSHERYFAGRQVPTFLFAKLGEFQTFVIFFLGKKMRMSQYSVFAQLSSWKDPRFWEKTSPNRYRLPILRTPYLSFSHVT